MGIYLPIAELSVNMLVLLGMGAAVGFLSGLFGVGGGFLITPLLIFYNIPPAIVAVGTSLVIVTANSGSGLVAYLGNPGLDWWIVATFTATAVVGSLIAGRYGRKIDTGRLQRWFAYLVFAVAARVLGQVIFIRFAPKMVTLRLPTGGAYA